MKQNWQQRLLIGTIAALTTFALILAAHLPYFNFLFLAVAVAVITIASWELMQLTIKVGGAPLSTLTLACIAGYVISVFIATQWHFLDFLPELALLTTLTAIFLYHFYIHEHPINTIANSLFPFAYLAIPLATAIPILYYFPENSTQEGRWWLLFLLTVVKINDVAAYIFGKMLGKHPMSRYISPKKTWEGSIAGFAAATLLGALFQPLLQIPFATAIALACALALAAQFGDLSESLLKRDAGTKDSNSLPGLGGVLDVVDALVFSCPLMYIFLRYEFKEAIV
ncbi:MAG: phosphatidate cytidylyltransferase [Parachlamydiales bacterium]|jgi:phosphatidate cytidylyltransferase